jgi:hypothetical protein
VLAQAELDVAAVVVFEVVWFGVLDVPHPAVAAIPVALLSAIVVIGYASEFTGWT